MGTYLLILLSLIMEPGADASAQGNQFEVEAQRKIKGGRQATARKLAISDALRKCVGDAAQQLAPKGRLDKKAKRAVHRNFRRFVSSYRILEEKEATINQAPGYKVRLSIELDMTSLRRALHPPAKEQKSAAESSLLSISVSLSPGDGLSSILSAQIAMESTLKKEGLPVLRSLAPKIQPRFIVTGECKLLSAGPLPENNEHGATVSCSAEINTSGTGNGAGKTKSPHSVSSLANGIEKDRLSALRTAMFMAGTELGKKTAALAIKKTSGCYSQWFIEIIGPVGFSKITEVTKHIEGALPQNSRVRPWRFKRGSSTVTVILPSCRKSISPIIKQLKIPGLELIVAEKGGRRLTVELTESPDTERTEQ